MNKRINILTTLLVLLSIICLVPAGIKLPQEDLVMFVVFAAFYFLMGILIYLAALKKLKSETALYERLVILKWELPQEQSFGKALNSKLINRGLIVFAVSVLLYELLYLVLGTGFINALCISLAVLFYLFALISAYTVRQHDQQGGNNGFALCHNALFLRGGKIRLDGTKNAVFEVRFIDMDQTLQLGVKTGKTTRDLDLPVPKDHIIAVKEFINDLNAHFGDAGHEKGDEN